jgi:hypothetical protein
MEHSTGIISLDQATLLHAILEHTVQNAKQATSASHGLQLLVITCLEGGGTCCNSPKLSSQGVRRHTVKKGYRFSHPQPGCH